MYWILCILNQHIVNFFLGLQHRHIRGYKPLVVFWMLLNSTYFFVEITSYLLKLLDFRKQRSEPAEAVEIRDQDPSTGLFHEIFKYFGFTAYTGNYWHYAQPVE